MTVATVRLLTLNIQGGLASSRYLHYLTQAWRHLLPSPGVRPALERIATLAARYDIVALQEADAGSFRTAQLDLVAHLASRAGFPHWRAAVTRELLPFARHCLGCLSRWPFDSVRYHALPGWLPGRGALEIEVRPVGFRPMRLFVVHLALGRRTRTVQLDHLAALVDPTVDTVVLGDFNCGLPELMAHRGVRDAGLRGLHDAHTFPSWRPIRALDHILVSPQVEVDEASVLTERVSDHLAVAAVLRLCPEPSR